ncbi:MAG: PASTA domain-containing protein [Clostridia bacterium]|nr:PASTA domain-containing protein [Clostridia bacterium]
MAVKLGKPMMQRMKFVTLILVIALFAVSTVSLVIIMIINGEKYQGMASEQQLYDNLVTAPRGDIYDSNMNILATSSTAWTVYITPNGFKKIKSDDEKENVRKIIAQNLSEILELDYEKVYEYTKKDSYYVVVKKKIDKTIADKIRKFISENEDLELTQYIGLDETTKRYYPNDSLASVVLGFVGDDDQGLAGIESYYDNSLTGVSGRVVAAKNAAGADMPFTYEKVEEAIKGNSLVLTIDSYMQYVCEKHLAAAVDEHRAAERGAAIAMNVNTGEVLAMAVKGDFNPNEAFTLSKEDKDKLEAETDTDKKKELRTQLLNRQWRNKSVSDTYEPGSVFKIVTASVALEEDLVNEKSTFNCSYVINIAGQSYHCHKKTGHGVQNMAQAISNSCNPAFITIGQLVGSQTFSKYFKAFGFTEKTGIDLPGEATSNYHKEENMGPTELASSSFGQTFNITPMQMLSAVSAAVNGGHLVQPHLVSKKLDAENKVIETVSTEYKRQVISKTTSDRMRTFLQFVAENGVKNALVPGYNVGAKSGTSQKVSKILSTGQSNLYISSCVAIAPIENPEIAVLVMIDEPTAGQYYGSAVSAPVCSSILADILPYMGYEPKYTEEELKNLSVNVPNVVGAKTDAAKNTITNRGLTYKIVGNGEKVIKQLPEEGEKISKGGMIILYTEETDGQVVEVPNLVGLTATQVNTAAATAGINIEFSGNTQDGGLISYRQSIPEGEKVAYGTVVTVYFKDNENAADIAAE